MPPSTEETRKYAKLHLTYEIWMVAGLVDRFKRFDSLLSSLDETNTDPAVSEVFDLVGRNADIEAFAIHSRILIDFLYDKKRRHTCVAKDFFEDSGTWSIKRPKKTKGLESIPSRAGVEVAHLSYARRDLSVPWDYNRIWDDLVAGFRAFVDDASAKHLAADTRAKIAALLPAEADERVRLDFPSDTLAAQRVRTYSTTAPPPIEVFPDQGTAIIRPSAQPPTGD
ncbi:MAG TPA: hypothetical protein VGH52_04140 [Gaiellaceae bacterium]|jgi:hypothetical protein